MQNLAVGGVIFVPDHQVHRQAFQTPVRMGLYEMAHQIDIRLIFDLKQDDGQITGNGVAPETGLSAAVLDENARVGAKRCIGVDYRISNATVKLRIGLGGIDLAQEQLTVSPRQIKDTIRKPSILVFLDQAQALVAGFADA